MKIVRIFIAIFIVAILVELILLLTPSSTTEKEKFSYPCEGKQDISGCLRNLIKETVNKKGIDKGMDLLVELYEEYPRVGENCHGFAHLIGESAYFFYVQNKDVKLSKKSGYCSYGFYHGFIETLMATSNDLKLAGRFCDEMSKIDVTQKGACYHGVGHGAATTHEVIKENEVQPMIDKSLDACSKISQEEAKIKACEGGVYNAVTIFYDESGFELPYSTRDPFSFCNRQKEIYSECYGYISSKLFDLFGKDFNQASLVILDQYNVKKISTKDAVEAMSSIAYQFASEKILDIKIQDSRFLQERCINLPKEFHKDCILGMIWGILESIKPGDEGKTLITFCKNGNFSKEISDFCYSNAVLALKGLYSAVELENLCSGLLKDAGFKCDNKMI